MLVRYTLIVDVSVMTKKFPKSRALIPKICGNCGGEDMNINWKLGFYHCRKCYYGGTISYAVSKSTGTTTCFIHIREKLPCKICRSTVILQIVKGQS